MLYKKIKGDGDYGFVDLSAMPQGNYAEGNIPFEGINWAVTREFSSLAKNHCAAVCVMNAALYFLDLSAGKLLPAGRENAFKAIHKLTGNGPVFFTAGKAKKYFSSCGVKLRTGTFGANFTKIQSSVQAGDPCVILLSNALVSWHWVLCIGWREYEQGERYLRIVDGWNSTPDRFYPINKSSRWITSTQYSMT